MTRSKFLSIWIVTAAILGLFWPSGANAKSREESLFEGLRLRSIGPAVMGGRIDDLAVVDSKPWIIYVGSASGGLWKTTNKGTTWEAVFDREETSSIGDVTLSPSDPEVVWVGTGEPNNRQSSTFGSGVYRSMDGGKTWEHKGLRDTHHVGRIAIHPRDTDIVYVAALGHLWGANEERGVFKTTDGGSTWEKVLYIDENTGVVDLAMDPVNPGILYAAAYQRRRTPWGFSGGGPGSGIHKSIDGGRTWKKLEKGLPEGDLGRIGIDVARSDPRVVYALVESKDGGTFRSEDRGESWDRVNRLNPRPMYYSKLRVDPNDARRLYVLGSTFYVSNDGGKTFRNNTDMTPTYDIGVHGDHHVLWVDPANSDHLVLGGDGGLYFSWDGSKTWDKVANIPIAQFYALDVDMAQPYNIYGGAQDTHSWGGPSATRNHIGILNGDWFQINFGDGMYQQVDPTDPYIIYTESQGGNIVRFDRRTGDRQTIRPYPPEGLEVEERYRFHWTAPILISPHDSKTIYLGGNRLFISNDQGQSWRPTSDLTRAEKRDELPIMGIVPDDETLSLNDGTSHWGTLTTVAESPGTPGLLWIGTDDGVVQLSRDGGTTWTSLEGKFPGIDEKRAMVSRVVSSCGAPGRAYVSFDRHRLDDFSPYLFATDDYGQSWRSISEDLPEVGWINVVVEHPRNDDLLFVGTETGLFVSIDRGRKWTRLIGDFPTVPVDDLVIHPRDNDLVVGTHGRAIYILDDLTPLEQLTPSIMKGAAHLFDTRTALQYLPWKHESYGAQRQFVGKNPPLGTVVSYYLGSEPEEEVSLVFFDGSGEKLRELVGSKKPGMNRVVWDMRTDAPEGVPRARGALVPPGEYTVRLTVGEVSREKTVTIEVDPHVEVTSVELRERYEFLKETGELVSSVHRAATKTQNISEQIEGLLEETGSEAPEELIAAAKKALEKAKSIRKALAGPGGRPSFSNPSIQMRLGMLAMELDGDDVRQGTLHGPTGAQNSRLASLETKVEEQMNRLSILIATDIPELNRQIEEAKLAWIRP